MEFDQKIQIIEWDYDPALASGLGKDIEKEKYKGIEISQKAMNLSEPTKNFREYVLKGILIHEKNELFDKHVANAYEYKGPNETIKAVKRTKDDPNRIDLLAAAINTMARLSALDTKPRDAGEYIKDDVLSKMWG
jgi:phage terminase large subunit-like protein